jgi:hypothetical protein
MEAYVIIGDINSAILILFMTMKRYTTQKKCGLSSEDVFRPANVELVYKNFLIGSREICPLCKYSKQFGQV